MTLPSNSRIALLLLLFAALLGLKVFDEPSANPPVVAAAARMADRSSRSAVTEQVAYPSAIRKRDLLDEGAFDLFALPPPPLSAIPPVVQHVVRPPPPSVPPLPVVPAAPAQPFVPPPPTFPYQAIGQYEVDGVRTVFLASSQGTVAVVEGQPIDPSWTVTSLRPDSMTVRHAASNFTTALALPTRQ